MNFIMSLFLGMLPEVLFLSLYIKFTKNIKGKEIKLIGLLSIGYILLIMLCRYQLIFYIVYIIYSYLITKKLYKSHISDIFIISIAYAYMTLISFICFKNISNYWISFIINRIVLFIPLLFKKYLNKFYKLYISLWNINKNAKIKSITLRNISLFVVNIMIVIMNLIMAVAIQFYSTTLK